MEDFSTPEERRESLRQYASNMTFTSDTKAMLAEISTSLTEIPSPTSQALASIARDVNQPLIPNGALADLSRTSFTEKKPISHIVGGSIAEAMKKTGSSDAQLLRGYAANGNMLRALNPLIESQRNFTQVVGRSIIDPMLLTDFKNVIPSFAGLGKQINEQILGGFLQHTPQPADVWGIGSIAKLAAEMVNNPALDTSPWRIGHSLQRAAELADLYKMDDLAGYMELLEHEVEERRQEGEEENEALRQRLYNHGIGCIKIAQNIATDPKAKYFYYTLGLILLYIASPDPATIASWAFTVAGGEVMQRSCKSDEENTED